MIQVPPNFNNFPASHLDAGEHNQKVYFSGTPPLEDEELDQIAVFLGYPPNSEIIKNAVKNFSQTFVIRVRKILWSINYYESAVDTFNSSPERDVVQIEDIKFNANKSSDSLEASKDYWINQLARICQLERLGSSSFHLGASNWL